MVKIAVLNTLVFILGITLGYTFASKQNPNQPAPMVMQNNSDAGPEKSSNSSSANGDPADATGSSSTAPLNDDEKASMARLIAAIPKPSVATGNGIITGSVQTADGRPLEGVFIRARYRPPSSEGRRHKKGGSAPKDRPIEEHVMNTIKNIQSQRLSRKEARSDGEGQFALAGLADGSYSLSAYLAGYELSSKSGNSFYRLKPGDTADYIAKPIVTVPVNVLLPDGASPEKASLKFSAHSDDNSSRLDAEPWYRDDPTIQLTPGRYTLKATCKQDGGEYTSDDQSLTLEAGVTPPQLTLQLKGRLGIQGKVVLDDFGKFDNLRVFLVKIPQGQSPDPSMLENHDKYDWVHEHDGYAYAFKDLSPGTYWIWASLSRQGKVLADQVVDVTDSTVNLDLVLPAMDPGDYVVVWALGPDNENLQDVSISTGYRSGSRSSSGGGHAIKQDDGSYRVLHHEIDEDHDVDWSDFTDTLTVRAKQFGQKKVTYDRKSTSEVTVKFSKPAFLNVVVGNYVGSGHEGKVSLSLTKSGSNQGHTFIHHSDQNKLDSQGRQTLGPVEPGEYDLNLAVRSGQNSNLPVERIPLALHSGDNSATISLPPLYTLVVVVNEPEPNMRIRIEPSPRRPGWWGDRQKVGEDGRCIFKQLPAGDYLLQERTNGPSMGKQMRVTVTGDMEIQFEPKEVNALSVSITDDNGYLAQSGFQSGDFVIGLDGKEFKNIMEFQMAFMAAMQKESVKMLVLRGNSRLDITMNPKKLMARENMGGDFEPTAR